MYKLMQIVVDQIRSDLESGDVSAIHVLLKKLDHDDLFFFLSEENQALVNHFQYDGQPDESQEWESYDPDC